MMNNLEKKYAYNDITVDHIFQNAKQDRQHLLIVFSGFSVDYEFRGGATDGCRSNILWIKDKFFGDYTYYLCHQKSFVIEQAVFNLIESFRIKLGLTKRQCTLMGFSKGGSAALFFGLKYDYSNIIASCPQINIGTYVSTNWKRPTRHMLGDNYNENDIVELNSILPKLLNSDAIVNKNIYLISSPQDIQYKSEIEPYLILFWRCKNFNFIFTKSALAWQHNKVTRYNIPIILSIVHAHGEGIAPHFGQVTNGISEYNLEHTEVILSEQKKKEEAITLMHKARLDDGFLYPDGCAFIKGIECKEYRQIKQYLILEGNEKYEFPLGKVMNEDLSYQHFDKVFCDYRAGGFSSIGYKGINLSNIDLGSYILKIKVQSDGLTLIKELQSLKEFNTQCLFNDRIYTIHTNGEKTILSIKKSINSILPYHFEVKDKWLNNNIFHIEGIYVVRGIYNENWGDSTYFLTLKSSDYEKSYKLGMCHYDGLNTIFEDHIGIYQKSYFCTIASKGITLDESIPDGKYDIYISMFKKGFSYSHKIDNHLSIINQSISLI